MQNTLLKEHNDNYLKVDSVLFLEEFNKNCANILGQEIYDKWISKLDLFILDKNEVIFSAPSKFIRDWVLREFVENRSKTKNLKAIASSIVPEIKKFSVIFKAKEEKALDEKALMQSGNKKVVNLSKYGNVFAFKTDLNPKFTFNNFVSVKYNKLAVSMAKIAAGVDKQIDLFDDKIPLFIHGGVGMGKTHLAQAIAWEIQKFDKDKKVVYLSAEKFMYHFVQSIRGNDVMGFKEKMRSIDVLIVDDIQFIAGKESTQQEFMNCFNSLVEDNKQVVLVCDRCPGDLENIDEKLKSRISGGMVVNFRKPDYQDRIDIVKQRVRELNSDAITDNIISFVAEKITDSIRDLDGAVRKLVAQNVLMGEEINMESARNILADYVKKHNDKAPTVPKIQKQVASFYNIKISDLTSKSRARAIARPRQIAMYLAKNLTKESLPKIGKEFGGKNHATVIHSVKLVGELMNNDPKIFEEVRIIEDKLK
ncbi:MAG: chromosomal replication initiator protein DnaA [Rickettsiales bacterium]|nr:chromosomal replication initiator protein DnaA [Rickettsiales bacterium]